MQRKFIEYDLPLADISEESAHEKDVHKGLPPQFQVWWARKPLASSRATIFATLLNDPGRKNKEERNEIKDLIKKISSWEVAKKEKTKWIRKAKEKLKKEYGKDLPRILDPFAGGGSIPFESLRFGANVYASDYNPVAVLIEKATIEWPQKYRFQVELPEGLREKEGNSAGLSFSGEEQVNLLLFMVERWADKILKKANNEINHYYSKDLGIKLVGKDDMKKQEGWVPVGYYYNRTIKCQNPSCEAKIPLTTNYWLSRKDNKQIAYKPVIDEENNINFELLKGKQLKSAIEDGFDPSTGTVSRANATCPVCGQVTEAKEIRNIAQNGKIGQRMIVVIFHHPDKSGKRYRLATEKDEEKLKKAESYLEKKVDEWNYLENALPDEKVDEEDHAVNRLPMYGMETWKEMFNPRQKLALITFIEHIRSSYDEIKSELKQIKRINEDSEIHIESLARAIMGYLGLLVTRQADFNSSFNTWNSYAELSAHTFSRQAIPMKWDYSEVNPFSGSTGSFETQAEYLLTSFSNFFLDSNSKVEIRNSSATNLPYEENSFDAVITDPPYYDSVPYAVLSDFFYVWLKRVIGSQFPELFSTPVVPKTNEAIMEPTRHESKAKAKKFFEKKLGKSFQEIHRVLKQNGTATIVYAHKSTEGWETMLNGLINAGFVVTASWPVHTERKGRLRAQASASLASSIYMVCRKIDREPVGFWKDLKPKIKERVQKKLIQFWKEGIVGGDLFISAIGPGMAIFSRYEEVQKYSGEKVSTRELLTFIRSITTDFVVNRLLKEASPSEIDKQSQFYLAYRWTYLDNKVEYDAARKIASGMGVDIEEMDDETGFVKKTRKYVRVYGPEDRTDYEGKIEDIGVNTMVDAMHKSLLLWEKGRKDKINEILAETGYAEEGSFWQFCQAVSESLVQGNDEKKKLEGFLMGRDKYVQSAKEMNEQAEKTKDMFEEE